MAFATLLILVVTLGGSSYLIGSLPLSISMSKSRLAQVSAIGTGLLLGAAMGVIIPEGIESIFEATQNQGSHDHGSHQHGHGTDSPTTKIAMSLLTGFSFMFIIEQVVSSYLSRAKPRPAKYEIALAPTGSNSGQNGNDTAAREGRDFDLEIEMELNAMNHEEPPKKNPKMLTLGLIVHSFADGLALGAANASSKKAAATPGEEEEPNWWDLQSSGLSLVVFFAIAIHKAPTALALVSTLLPQLPVRQVKQHLIAFSLASPFSALATYLVLTVFGGGEHVEGWTGVALMFSGGTFLYVATVLSALPAHSHGETTSHPEDTSDLSPRLRLILVVSGMFIPLGLSSLFGHGH